MNFSSITKENYIQSIATRPQPWQKNYLAMYSSQWQGITTDPELMTIPIDDHLVHRGDGIFDVMRCVHGKIYQLKAHLERLERSAAAISLDFPPDYTYIEDVLQHLLRLGGEKNCLIRIVISRGPGSFSPNPMDCPMSHMYVNTIRFKRLPEEYYSQGVAIITSKIPIKKTFFANIKSCDYLPNVLMVKEAVEAGCYSAVALDEEGFLAEGPIENVGVVNSKGVLKFPSFERTLSGTTVVRIFELAKALVQENIVNDVMFDKISRDEAYASEEVFLMGTSLNVLPVVKYDGRQIGKGVPGSVYAKLSERLWEDMTENEGMLTEIHWDA